MKKSSNEDHLKDAMINVDPPGVRVVKNVACLSSLIRVVLCQTETAVAIFNHSILYVDIDWDLPFASTTLP